METLINVVISLQKKYLLFQNSGRLYQLNENLGYFE